MRKKTLIFSLLIALLLLLPASTASAAPILQSPANGSAVSSRVTFIWTAGDGPPYILEVTNLSTGTVSTLTLTTTRYSLTLAPSSYSWRVQDSTSWSPSWVFYVQSASIWINPQQGYAGTPITIYGYDWIPGETIRIYYDSTLRQTIFPASSYWTATIVASGAIGYHTITVAGTISGTQVASFRVIGPPPTITLSRSQGAPGEPITISGSNFYPYESIRVTFAGFVIPQTPIAADATGSWGVSFTIPERPAGLYTVDAYGSTTLSTSVADQSFRIIPTLAASPNAVRIKEQVTISGMGFHASSTINLTCDGTTFSAISNSLGSFSTTMTAPSKGLKFTITARDNLGESASTTFTIISPISVMLNLSTGAVGEELTISGNSQVPGTVTISYDGATIGKLTPDASGSFIYSFKIPKSNVRHHTITATDSNGNSATATFALESTPPPIPRPLEPDQFSKVRGRTARFEWSEVSDPSGVSYNLIVYDSSMREVLNISGIEATSLEARLPTKGTFSWLVQAQDGAGNLSPRSDVIYFTAGQGLPVWAIVIIILAALFVVAGGIYYYFFRFFRQPRKAPVKPASIEVIIQNATEKTIKKLTPEISDMIKKEVERQLAPKGKARRRKPS